MRRIRQFGCHRAAVALSFLLLSSNAFDIVKAQEILYNAIVYTVDENNPHADAIAIDENGTIAAVGNFSNISLDFPSFKLTDLDGQLVLPGFQDAHVHAVEAGINNLLCYVGSEGTIEDIPYYFEANECANYGEFGGQGWVMGAGVDLAKILGELEVNATTRYPIVVLDEYYPSTPVVILDRVGHGALANTVALEAVGYTTMSRDPPGGQILRDVDGALMGIVTENAQHRLREAAFPPTEANQELAYRSLLQALEELRENGITTVSDAGGFWRQAQTEAWARAEAEMALTVRASNALYVYPDITIDEQLPDLMQRYSNDPDALVRFNQAKIYVDGILSLSSARLYEPYEFDPLELYRESSEDGWRGVEYFGDNVTLNFMSQSLANVGFQLHYHAVGDAAAGLALSAIESVRNNYRIEPHRLTHLYLVDEKDRARFAELGVVADFQLTKSSINQEYMDGITNFIGVERAEALLPAVEVYEAGALVTLSSDWDADDLSPLEKIEAALTRPNGRNFPNVESVIPLLTLNPAILLQHDDRTGSITVGKYADLVVIDKDIFSLEPEMISSAEITRTYLQGQLIHGGIGGAGGFSHESKGDGTPLSPIASDSEVDVTRSNSESSGATRVFGARLYHCILASWSFSFVLAHGFAASF